MTVEPKRAATSKDRAPVAATQPTAPAAAAVERPLGAHLPLGGGMVRAVERAAAIGARTLQIFSDNPTAWRRRASLPDELPAFRARLRELGMGPLAIHAPYLINLAGSDPVFWELSVETMASELRVGEHYGARFVNVHIGSHKGAGLEPGVERLAQGLRRVLDEVPQGPESPLLILENSAGNGGGLGVSVDELARILDATGAAGVDPMRIGFCLDTAHLWAAGHEINRADRLDELLRHFDARLGADKLAMLHLNDARTTLGSRLDRHEHVGAGSMGVGFGEWLRHPRLADVPGYLETPGMDLGFDALNMERLHLLVDGSPLPDLPPEAFSLPPRRGRASAPVDPERPREEPATP